MQEPPTEGHKPRKIVFIVGSRMLQDELMASFIEKVTGARCITLSNLDDLPPLAKTSDTTGLVLWDCRGKNGDDCLSELESHRVTLRDLLVSLFNGRPSHGFEERAVNEGVKGFFYEHDPFDLIAKGVSAIFDGELWVPRRVLADCINRSRHERSSPEMLLLPLTPREREILKLIANGVTDGAIADMLCISHHTVKNHVYNIFKKINVHNRLQAALWAAKNL